MSAQEDLKEAVKAYKAFLARGGNRGSQAGRARREHISALMVEVKDERFRAERITKEDEIQAVEHVEVFGE